MKGEECLLEMTKILKEIVSLSEKNSKEVKFEEADVNSVVYLINLLKNSCDMRDVKGRWTIKLINETLDDLNNFVTNRVKKKSLKI